MEGGFLREERQKVNRQLFGHKLLQQTISQERGELSRARREVGKLEEALAILQEVAQQVEQEAHSKIASVVTRCLEAVFEEPYEFRILFEKKRGQTEARLIFLQHGEEIDPKSSCSGGVLDVAAFALRLACLLLSKPPVRKVLFLDESFRMVAKENLPRVGQLLEELSEELKVQIILVTHSEQLQVGKVVRLT